MSIQDDDVFSGMMNFGSDDDAGVIFDTGVSGFSDVVVTDDEFDDADISDFNSANDDSVINNDNSVGKKHNKWLKVVIVLLVLAMFGRCVGGKSDKTLSENNQKQQTTVGTDANGDTNNTVVISGANVSIEEVANSHKIVVTAHVHNGTAKKVHSSDLPSILIGNESYGSSAIVKSDEENRSYLKHDEDGTVKWEVTTWEDLAATCSFDTEGTGVAGLGDVKSSVETALSEHIAADEEAKRVEEEQRQAEAEQREQERLQREAEEAARPKTTEEILQEKLDVAVAMTAMEQYGESQYPYGFKLNIWADNNQDVAEDENTWLLRYEVTITNAFGAEYKTTACAKVSGTTDSPHVDDFWVA